MPSLELMMFVMLLNKAIDLTVDANSTLRPFYSGITYQSNGYLLGYTWGKTVNNQDTFELNIPVSHPTHRFSNLYFLFIDLAYVQCMTPVQIFSIGIQKSHL